MYRFLGIHGTSRLVSSRLVILFKGQNARSPAPLTPFTDCIEMTDLAGRFVASQYFSPMQILVLTNIYICFIRRFLGIHAISQVSLQLLFI